MTIQTTIQPCRAGYCLTFGPNRLTTGTLPHVQAVKSGIERGYAFPDDPGWLRAEINHLKWIFSIWGIETELKRV